MSRPKNAAVKDIDIDIADILGQKYRYRIDIGKDDINPPLMRPTLMNHLFYNLCVVNLFTKKILYKNQ